jgi:hypothetical protein
MADIIIISLSEMITCPNDKFSFPLHQGIEESLIAEKRREYARERAEVRVQIEREVRETYAVENDKRHADELRQRDALIDKIKAQAEEEKERITLTVSKEFEVRLQNQAGQAAEAQRRLAEFEKREAGLVLLQKELAQKEQALKVDAVRQVELEREQIRKAAKAEEAQRAAITQQQLTEEKRTLEKIITELQRKNAEDGKRQLELQVQLNSLKVNQDAVIQRASLEAAEVSRRDAVEQESKKFELKLAELEKQRDDARQAADGLRRQLEQGSQQIQGDVLEELVERELPQYFKHDLFERIGKGINGADFLHKVVNDANRLCGSITWEVKNAKNWNPNWVDKLRNDQSANDSEFGVLVTTSLPPGIEHFGQVDGIWVCDLTSVIGLATCLRLQVINLAYARASAEGRDQKMDVLYQYLVGPQFRNRVDQVMKTFIRLQKQVAAERRTMSKQWNAREQGIQIVIDTISAMYGDLQEIVGETSLPEIPSLVLEESEDGQTPE